jgi:hypothetical protein
MSRSTTLNSEEPTLLFDIPSWEVIHLVRISFSNSVFVEPSSILPDAMARRSGQHRLSAPVVLISIDGMKPDYVLEATSMA